MSSIARVARFIAPTLLLLGVSATPAAATNVSPGTVVQARQLTLSGSWGKPLPNAAYQLRYSTTDASGNPTETIATVILPTVSTRGPRKLVAYQMAYDGLSEDCRPSVGLADGKAPEGSLMKALDRGWVVVTADYEGPGDAWVAGRMAGHAVLDAVRAAERFRPAGLPGARTQVALMGYSGGGQATAWANELAATYAPELRIVGAAQGGVPANPAMLAESLDGSVYAGVMFAAIAGLSAGYPEADIPSMLNGKGKALMTKLHAQGCIINFALSYPFQRLRSITVSRDFLATPTVQRILRHNTLGDAPPATPTFMYHAVDDHLLAVEGTRALARAYCKAGVPLLWKTGIGDHIGLPMLAGSQPLDYIADRLAGKPAPTNCA